MDTWIDISEDSDAAEMRTWLNSDRSQTRAKLHNV